jgi:membrane protein YdbS with pleckstrin-like domain
MKQWQKEKLHTLLDLGIHLNRNAWMAGAVGAVHILVGTWLESIWAMYAGGILLAIAMVMMLSTDIILCYVKWRKKRWK